MAAEGERDRSMGDRAHALSYVISPLQGYMGYLMKLSFVLIKHIGMSTNRYLNSDVTIKVYFAIAFYFNKSRNISSVLEYDVTFPFFISSMPAL